HGNLQSILRIASSFYSFTNILINDFKARLLFSITKPVPKKKNQPRQSSPSQTTFNISPSHNITVKFTPYATSIRYLGAWISIKKMILLLSATQDGLSVMLFTICVMLV